MKQKIKKSLSIILAAMMLICSVPLAGLAGVATEDLFKVSAATITEYEVGDIIEFGWYPQSKVTDSSIISALNSADGEWISYGYYSGTGDSNDGQMKPGDYMRYKDVIYGSEKYRGVVFDTYRPFYTGYKTTIDTPDTYQTDNGYICGTVYWFKYEPIKWRVLNPNTGMVMAKTILDSQAYNNYVLYSDGEFWGDSSKKYYANNYAESSIRRWLNDDFYNTAFSTAQMDIINYTSIDNSTVSSSFSKYDSETTCDKIYLLSYYDTINSSYGFSSSRVDYDTARLSQGSDYAKCQGLYVYTVSSRYNGNSFWQLRTSGLSGSDRYYVYYSGDVNGSGSTYSNYDGVRPALNFNLNSTIFQSNVEDTGNFGGGTTECEHSYTSTITTPAACTTDGVMTYTCTECGDVYTEPILATGHNAGEWEVVTNSSCTAVGEKAKKCTVCGEILETEEIAMNEHTAGEWEITSNATCTENGEKIKKCVNCATVLETAEIPATGHNQGSWVISIEPTCIEEGEMVAHCTECGVIVANEMISAKGHKAGAWITVLEPTTEAEGKKVKKCVVCDVILEEAAIAKLPKEPVKDSAVVKNPSTSTINYGDAIILHVDASKIPEGGYVEWTASNGNFSYKADGTICTISPAKSGDTTFTATIYDADGNAVSTDEQTMTSKAGFFDKIIAFFKGIFGLTKTYPDVFGI